MLNNRTAPTLSKYNQFFISSGQLYVTTVWDMIYDSNLVNA